MPKKYCSVLLMRLSLAWVLGLGVFGESVAASQCPALLQSQFPRLQDEVPQSLCQYAGKVLLVVNTASFCGYTRQYEGLEKLNEKYQSKGLVVLGFPSAEFGNQEYGNNKQIAEFCNNTYGVKFPMFAKTKVKGPQANALYKQLTQATGEAPQWNFHKYLIDRNGQVLGGYSSAVEPNDKKLVADIESALNAASR